ncbi:oxidoreductase [Pedobacter arcticus]|uniref:oxidoreductase n=1 Tax=Pedobacter arcticus TaxID=752140 RepID=UPI0002FA4E3D|nr:oxidoreductase [Pedobacter arcticus]
MGQKIALITGANAGLGFEESKHLAEAGYRVIMACRDIDKGLKAKKEILASCQKAVIDVLELDLSSQKSVRLFADLVKQDYHRLDLLINNAGIMMTPKKITEDGFENQLATNYLGHFALTGYLLHLLKITENSRVVSLSSLAHRWSDIRFSDINFVDGYDKREAYGQSKLACLMFAYELERRLKVSGYSTISVVAHPGISSTNLFKSTFLKWLSPIIGQPAKDGAKPILYAALSKGLDGGEYIGPDGFNEWRGNPKIVDSNLPSKNNQNAKRLWELSEELTGVKYQF